MDMEKDGDGDGFWLGMGWDEVGDSVSPSDLLYILLIGLLPFLSY